MNNRGPSEPIARRVKSSPMLVRHLSRVNDRSMPIHGVPRAVPSGSQDPEKLHFRETINSFHSFMLLSVILFY